VKFCKKDWGVKPLSLSLSLSLTNLGFCIIPRVSWELLNTTTNLQNEKIRARLYMQETSVLKPNNKNSKLQ
jgi:hypothetical protein